MSVMCLSAYKKDCYIQTNKIASSEEILLTPEGESLSIMREKMSKHKDRSNKINKCHCYHNSPLAFRVEHKIECL